MAKKHLFSWLLTKAILMALWTKASLCVKSSLLEQSLLRPPSQLKSLCPLWLFSLFLCAFCAFLWLKNPRNQRNPRLINELRVYKTLYNCRETITDVMDSLQISSFMQNKPNFLDALMSVSTVITGEYENIANFKLGENKPNTNPIKANTKPIKANTKPKQTQYKPKQTQFQCSIMLNCAICSANTSTGTGKFRESADTYYDRENILVKYCEMAMIVHNVAYTMLRPKGNKNSRSKCAFEVETI